MTSSASNSEDLQIAVRFTKNFLRNPPSCFEIGSDKKLHHDHRQVNVISHDDDFFADAYPEVLNVEDLDAFLSLKERLLSLPIYMSVQVQKRSCFVIPFLLYYCQKTSADVVIMVNTKHPDIQAQLREKLDKAEATFREGKKFALEIDFEKLLCQWFELHLEECGYYCAWRSNFCVTNYRQKCGWCSSPAAWIACLPVCLLVAPLHCACRALFARDIKLKVRATATSV